MSKTKRPLKAVPTPPSPVLQGDCFRTFLDEARSIGNEVVARRAFAAEIGEYLAKKGLVEDFEAWRKAKTA